MHRNNQRAFRQRKEGYIKKLEQQVRDYAEMENNYKTMQTENYALREYVIHLQSKLLDAKADLPQPPANVNLSHPQQGGAVLGGVPGSTSLAPPVNPLATVAQAVAQLGADGQYSNKGFKPDHPNDDAHTADEITRQLQADGMPPPAPM